MLLASIERSEGSRALMLRLTWVGESRARAAADFRTAVEKLGALLGPSHALDLFLPTLRVYTVRGGGWEAAVVRKLPDVPHYRVEDVEEAFAEVAREAVQ